MASIVMPQPGQSVTEGTVIRWLKQVGDHVAADEVIAEIETEKVNIELPSPFDGTLSEILVAEGETVPVGADLAVIAVAGETPAPRTPGAAVAAVPAAAMERGRAVIAAPSGDGGAAVAAPLPTAADASPRRNGAAEGGTGRYSPAVLRLAAEHNLDLSQIAGSGMGGRVTRKDVVRFLERGAAAPPAPASVAASVEAGTSAAPDRGAAAPPAPPAPDAAPETSADEEVIRPSPTRLTIARNMLRTAQTVPVAWMVVETDLTGLVRLRERQREAFRGREGVDLTYLPFVVQAVVAALREHPMLNSEWRDEQIVLKKRLNIGVAVGAQDGLVVPVIHDADRLSLTGLAHAIADLAERARARRLKLEDVTGGTFTVDNTGVFGSLVSQPIINPPQAAILSTEAVVKRPVVVDDGIAVRSMMNLCIAFDHRILDGTQVGPFMQSVKRRLEAITAETPLV